MNDESALPHGHNDPFFGHSDAALDARIQFA
jgi:hypothetical protein